MAVNQGCEPVTIIRHRKDKVSNAPVCTQPVPLIIGEVVTHQRPFRSSQFRFSVTMGLVKRGI